ncbi:hypothetical protein DPMN_075104 [Dreissena polymorpha]|uniref:Uncharacterized protein n=1 Tax=Dreissena polymorpha TaxID=45954 RepID=A0A9D3YKG7_DREPO|nr:hypothetical protein DPMN_075104 [Dreissena polymorpha]
MNIAFILILGLIINTSTSTTSAITTIITSATSAITTSAITTINASANTCRS